MSLKDYKIDEQYEAAVILHSSCQTVQSCSDLEEAVEWATQHEKECGVRLTYSCDDDIDVEVKLGQDGKTHIIVTGWDGEVIHQEAVLLHFDVEAWK